MQPAVRRGAWRIARWVAEDRVISVHDPDARHAHKTVTRRRDGFKAHLVVEPDTGLITGCQLTKASGEGGPSSTRALTSRGSGFDRFPGAWEAQRPRRRLSALAGRLQSP